MMWFRRRRAEGQRRAFNQEVTPVYDFSKATRIVALDAHFFARRRRGSLRYAREFAQTAGGVCAMGAGLTRFAAARMPPAALTAETLSRLYVAESTVTYTGAMADHRIAVKPGLMARVACELARLITGDAAADAICRAARRCCGVGFRGGG